MTTPSHSPQLSHVQRLLRAKDVLSAPRKQIFEALYQRGEDPQVAARGLSMSPELFDQEHGAMLRELKSAASTN
jgi:hypothetical protein